MNKDSDDFLQRMNDAIIANPFRDVPDAEMPDSPIVRLKRDMEAADNGTIPAVPLTLYEDTITDLRDEINDYRTDNARLAVERKRAVADAGRITARLNLALAQVHDLARLRRTLERSRWYWRLAALTGWALWLVALVRR